MNSFLKQNWIKISLGVLILGTLFFIREWGNSSSNSALTTNIIWPTNTPENNQPPIDNVLRGAWLDNLDNLPIDDWDKDGKCLDAIRKQISYLKNEKLSEQFTFDKYKIDELFMGKLADLDISNNKYARTFRTMLSEGLEKEGVNFAGHYSIVSVGMTGIGDSYYIVDRINGNAYPFPYQTFLLDFKKDSNLILMNPKKVFLDTLKTSWNPADYCRYRSYWGNFNTDARPFYFLWENNELKLLGPTDIEPPINGFWEYYF